MSFFAQFLLSETKHQEISEVKACESLNTEPAVENESKRNCKDNKIVILIIICCCCSSKYHLAGNNLGVTDHTRYIVKTFTRLKKKKKKKTKQYLTQ